MGLSMIGNEPSSVEIKKSRSFTDRLYWLFNGAALIGQTWFILSHSIEDNFAGAYAILATIFGSISVVSAFYPRFPWNKKLF